MVGALRAWPDSFKPVMLLFELSQALVLESSRKLTLSVHIDLFTWLNDAFPKLQQEVYADAFKKIASKALQMQTELFLILLEPVHFIMMLP